MNPLEPFYRAIGAAAPSFETIRADAVPAPFDRLLVHERDMTSTLEAFVGQPLSLKVLQTRIDGECLSREVVLTGDHDGTPAEFGAIKIFVDRLPVEAARRHVREGHRPLGSVLRELGIEHGCRPVAFFHVRADAVMREALGLNGDVPLYGRHNLLYGAKDVLLAEVTEILPPFTDGMPSDDEAHG